jgi:predicted phage gp36 major capsid-like protein
LVLLIENNNKKSEELSNKLSKEGENLRAELTNKLSGEVKVLRDDMGKIRADTATEISSVSNCIDNI